MSNSDSFLQLLLVSRDLLNNLFNSLSDLLLLFHSLSMLESAFQIADDLESIYLPHLDFFNCRSGRFRLNLLLLPVVPFLSDLCEFSVMLSDQISDVVDSLIRIQVEIMSRQGSSIGDEFFSLMSFLLKCLLDHLEDMVHLLSDALIREISVSIEKRRQGLEGAIQFSTELLDLLEVVSDLDSAFQSSLQVFVSALKVRKEFSIIIVQLMSSVEHSIYFVFLVLEIDFQYLKGSNISHHNFSAKLLVSVDELIGRIVIVS